MVISSALLALAGPLQPDAILGEHPEDQRVPGAVEAPAHETLIDEADALDLAGPVLMVGRHGHGDAAGPAEDGGEQRHREARADAADVADRHRQVAVPRLLE